MKDHFAVAEENFKQKSKAKDLDASALERLEREARLYPQGGNQKIAFRDKLIQEAPFYLRSNKPTIVRKMDETNPGYVSNIEEARKRYEE